MKTTTNTAPRGTCTVCGQMVTMIEGLDGEMILNYHGQKIGKGASGIAGRCTGGRLPSAEIGAERLAAHAVRRAARVASYG